MLPGGRLPHARWWSTRGVCVSGGQRRLLVRQFRYPFGRALYELPAGKLERADYGSATAQLYRNRRKGWAFLSWGALPVPGLLTEVIHIYYATKLTFTRSARRRRIP